MSQTVDYVETILLWQITNGKIKQLPQLWIQQPVIKSINIQNSLKQE